MCSSKTGPLELVQGEEDISIKKLTTIPQFLHCEELQRRVWGLSDTDVVPLHLLLIAQKSGGLVLGASDKEGKMIGFVFGFLGARDAAARQLKHCSHMLGVLEEWRGRGVGYQLKLAQRAHALAQGLELVTWTYDPLESLNAALNIGKLGVVCNTYIRDLYGEMEDERNVGLSSDRLEVAWWITSQRVAGRLASGGYQPSLDALLESGARLLNPATIGPDGLVRPSPTPLEPAVETVLVEIPAHLQAIKTADIALARQWRAHAQELFERCFTAGYTATEFISELQNDLRRSFYVLQRDFEVI